MNHDDNIKDIKDINDIICAEILDHNINLDLYNIISHNMMHDSYDSVYSNLFYIINKKYSKKYS